MSILLLLFQNTYTTKALADSTIGSDPIASEPIATAAYYMYGASGTGQAGTPTFPDALGAAGTGTVGGIPSASGPPSNYTAYWPMDNSLSPGGGSLIVSGEMPTYTSSGWIGDALQFQSLLEAAQP